MTNQNPARSATATRYKKSRQAPGAFRSLALERRGDIEWLTLTRPRRLNAINPEMAAELNRYFSELRCRQDVRVIILRGAGRHFCAGFDLDNIEEVAGPIPPALQMQRQMSEIVLNMRRCPQPIIAALQGAACGAGFALALAADVRYAASNARMNVAMARVGLTGCDMGISYFLPRTVGSSIASELMLSGRFVGAQRAVHIGLISQIAEPPELDRLAESLAQDMVRLSPSGLRLTKEGVTFGMDAGSLDAAIAMEDRGQILCAGPYMREGVAAFRKKRPPRYP